MLKEVARQRLNAGQLSFDLPGLNSENDAGSAPQEPAGAGCVAPIASNRMGVLLEALEAAWKAVGLDRLDGADEVFRQLVTARLIEPTSKQDSLRVLAEAGLSPVSYATVKRHLPSYATEDFTRDLSRLLAGYARIGRASLVLFDVTTLYFETDKADGFREPGFSKERRLEPQITVGLLTDETGFPLRAGAFEGNKAETATMIPMINDFMDAYDLDDVVVVADAGMISAANRQALERACLSYVLGSRTSRVPHVISSWHDNHPDQDVPDGLTLTQPWPAGPSDQRRDETIYYRYSADRARRTLRGIDTQVAKAEKAVAGKIPVKRNRFVHLSGATRSNHPDRKPYYCPLHESRHDAAVALYHRLLQPVPDDATDYWIHLADMAVMIPTHVAAFWYRLIAIAETPWIRVDQDTDTDKLLTAARNELDTTPPPRVHGDHPGTRPAPARPVTSATSRRLWCVTTRSAHPDDETIRPALIDAPGLRTLDNARRLHLLMAAQLDLPTEDLTYWHCLQATAIGPWTAADTHTSTDMLLTALLTAARNDPA